MRSVAAPHPLARAVFGALLVWFGLATPAAAAKPEAPRATPSLSPLGAQGLKVRSLARERHRPAYAEALLALAKLKRDAGDVRGALNAAREAAGAFDTQVEMHKTLSDALPVFAESRAERAAALALGLRRDEAFYLVAELAQALGESDVAIRHYVLIVQSQADQPRGRDAYLALRRLGWAASPIPAAAAGSGSSLAASPVPSAFATPTGTLPGRPGVRQP